MVHDEKTMRDTTCDVCGAWMEDHDYEHQARVCMPERISTLEAALREADYKLRGHHASSYRLRWGEECHVCMENNDVFATIRRALGQGGRDE